MNFSARVHDRTLKVARTPADLAGATNIRPTAVLATIRYLLPGREGFVRFLINYQKLPIFHHFRALE
jgi:hypothetical protein